MSWRRAYAACAALVLAFHFRLAWPGHALVANDFRALFIPLRIGLQHTLREGSLPFWQRGMFLGYPMLGDIQFQLLNPLTWLTLPLDAARGITVQSLAELCICAIGVAYWMKQRGLQPIHGVFAGCVFALSLKQTVHLHHWTFAASTCMWPWMLAGVEKRSVPLTAFATLGTWLGSSPQMAYFGTALAAVYALSRRDLRTFLAVPLGVAMAAPLLLPVAELSAWGPRGPGVTYRFQSQWSWPGREVWAAMVLPRVWGGRAGYDGPMNYWEVQGYVGLLPMALLAAVPWRKTGAALFAAVAVLCLWFSFGSESWLGFHRLLTHLPGYGGFRNPTRALMLVAFCVAVLSAEGLASLETRRTKALVAIAALSALCLLPTPRDRTVQLVAFVLLGLATAFVLWRPRWAPLAIALFLADVAWQTWDSPEIGDAGAEGRALAAFDPAVPKPPAPRRVAAMLDWGEGNNATLARGWEGVTGYGPTPILRVLLLLLGTREGAPPAPGRLNDDPNFPRFRTDSPLSRLFAAPLVVTDRDASATPIAEDGHVRLFEMPALPRVYWSGSYEVAPDDRLQGTLAAAAGGTFVVLPESPAFPPGERGFAPARDVQVTANRVKATLTAPRDGLAVVLEPWFPGWSLRLDGRAVEPIRANYAFLAVPVAAGTHTLELSYFPTRLLPGLLVCAIALVLLRILAAHRVDSGGAGVYFPPP